MSPALPPPGGKPGPRGASKETPPTAGNRSPMPAQPLPHQALPPPAPPGPAALPEPPTAAHPAPAGPARAVPRPEQQARRPQAATPRSPRAVPDRALQDLWVARLRARDPETLREVVEAFGERLTAVVSGILRDRDAVDDVVQETFTKAWFRIEAFRGGSSLYTWLYRVAVNGCKDHVKSRRRRPAMALDERQAAGLPGHEAPAIERLERREDRLRLRRAIESLSPRDRSVLALREIEGMAYAEIAEVLHLSMGTVESRLFRARRRLERALRAAGAGPDAPERGGRS